MIIGAPSITYNLLTQVTLPGGGKLGIYQPRHARPQAIPAEKNSRGPAGHGAKRHFTEP